MEDDRIRELIARLEGDDAERAWREFLEEYAELVQRVVRRFEQDPDRQGDCFVFVCERLARNDARRLRAFDPDGPASFSTWLMAVVSNLVVDWRRSVLGRYRPFRSIARLEPLQVEIYRAVLERGMSLEQTWAALRYTHPSLTLERVTEVVDELHAKLTSRQHWLLSTRWPHVRSIETLVEDSGDPEASPILASRDEDPEARAERAEEHRRLAEAIEVLSVEERLAIRLRFQEGMTLREVGRLMDLGDPFRARRLLDRAIARLEDEWLGAAEPDEPRKERGSVRVQKREWKRTESDG